MDGGYAYKSQDLMDLSLNIPDSILLILAGKNLTTIEKVLKTSNIDLISFGMTEKEVYLLKSAISANVPCTTFMTVLECSSILAIKWRHITFKCAALDKITRNGLPIRGITEIVGESGCGKSQICLQLALNVQLPLALGGLAKSAVYICTEDAFPSKRLVQIASFYRNEFRNDDWLDNIFVEHVQDSEKLMACVNRLPRLMAQQPIGLIIIDSVAGIFRLDSDAITRADNMRKLIHTIQMLQDEYECGVICVNQVTASMKDTTRDRCIPSLGLAWSNLVTTQMKIRKINKHVTRLTGSQTLNSPIRVRSLEISFSPDLPNKFAEFIITTNGICDVPSF